MNYLIIPRPTKGVKSYLLAGLHNSDRLYYDFCHSSLCRLRKRTAIPSTSFFDSSKPVFDKNPLPTNSRITDAQAGELGGTQLSGVF